MTDVLFDHHDPLVRPGRNCWRLAIADRLAVVVDAEEYFRALTETLPKAERSILIVGWEFDSRTRLLRGAPRIGSEPNEIGMLLDHLAHTRPWLDIRVLIWDSALIYAVNREFAGLVKMDWFTHPRLRFRLDDSHPLGASHHQKIVVIDDALAFVGGLDVTSQRWDSRQHLAADPRRWDPAFPDYPPFHDVMAMLTGEAAGMLADICRERWRRSSGQIVPVPPPGDGEALWPSGWTPEFERIEVAVARTAPAWDGEPHVYEVERLYLDLIAAARRLVFIENQYFASRRVAAALVRRLGRRDCPEIAVIGPGESVSLLERSTMALTRARLYRRLLDADSFGRLRLYYPVSGDRDVKVHSKVMVVDDEVLRIGSANLNNRSMGLDTECDIVVEALGRAERKDAISRIRHGLLAEHLGVEPERVAAAEAEGGGMLAAIDGLRREGRSQGRTLEPLDPSEPAQVLHLLAGTGLPDPEHPVEMLLWVENAMPGPAKRPLQVRILALYAVLGLLALAGAGWGFAPPEMLAAAHPWVERVVGLRSEPATALVVVGLFVAGGFVRLPPSLLVLGTAAVLGPWTGAAFSLLGALASASALYGLGRALGRRRVRRLAGWKVHRVNRALSRHGIFGMLLLRLMPVAAFAVINLVAGAAAVGFRDFVIGTILGMSPGIIAMSVLGDRVVAVLRRPDVINIAVLAAATLLVIAAGIALVNRLALARGGVRVAGRRRAQEA
jgi:phospholipase D1/2